MEEVDEQIGQKGGAVTVAGRIGVAGLDDAGGEIETQVVAKKEARRAGMEKRNFTQEFQTDAKEKDGQDDEAFFETEFGEDENENQGGDLETAQKTKKRKRGVKRNGEPVLEANGDVLVEIVKGAKSDGNGEEGESEK